MNKQIGLISVVLFLPLILSACGGNSGETTPADIEETINNVQGNSALPNTTLVEAVFPPVYQTPEGVVECSIEDINRRVEFDMKDYYLYYDQVPDVNLSNFDTPQELMAALRVAPDRFSNVQNAQSQNNQSDLGLVAEYGFWFRPAADGVVRFREIDLGSPADAAGISRGDEVLAINGMPINELTDADIREELAEEKSPILMSFRTGDEPAQTVLLENEQFFWTSAGYATRYTSSSNPDLPAVGYLSVAQFLDTTANDIDIALNQIGQQGEFQELIVDLRYNSGGRTWVARRLASIVGGQAVGGEVFLKRVWNDKYSAENADDVFDTIEGPLNLPRIFVLTSGFTSSASEAFINALEPYIDVVVIGGVTSGKPFTSNSRQYCDVSINAMRSIRTNAVGVSVAGGIQPDCLVQDNWETDLPSTRDPLTNVALDYIVNGGCSVVATTKQRTSMGEESGATYKAPRLFVPEE